MTTKVKALTTVSCASSTVVLKNGGVFEVSDLEAKLMAEKGFVEIISVVENAVKPDVAESRTMTTKNIGKKRQSSK